ncbi:MAG: FO synthase [Desulfitobacterium hafniense]|nr:FO synthase [Desulfitobacterium hafniense]
MPSLFSKSELHDLIIKVERGERLNFAEGVRLMESKDILALGYMANLVRERKNGNNTYFMVNRHINHTNICVNLGRFCKLPFDMRTNATMLYGHIETSEERIDHFIRLRELQDRTGGFLTFMPLPFLPKNTQLEGTMGVQSTTGFEDLKVLAVSRIMLDNFDHVKAFWIMLGPKLAQVSLSFGVDDLDGTVIEERIIHAAGDQTGQAMTKRALINMIKKAGRIPVERDILYSVLNYYGTEGGES